MLTWPIFWWVPQKLWSWEIVVRQPHETMFAGFLVNGAYCQVAASDFCWASETFLPKKHFNLYVCFGCWVGPKVRALTTRIQSCGEFFPCPIKQYCSTQLELGYWYGFSRCDFRLGSQQAYPNSVVGLRPYVDTTPKRSVGRICKSFSCMGNRRYILAMSQVSSV